MSVDFSWITDRIATGGGISSKADVDVLVGAGVTHIIDMRAEFDDDTLGDPRVQILWLPQQDDNTPRPLKHYRQGIQFAYVALALPAMKVFAHCAAGVNRGPLMTYALLRGFGIPQQEAIDRIRAKRPQVQFYTVAAYIQSVEQALLQ